jgi:hypothetical protein
VAWQECEASALPAAMNPSQCRAGKLGLSLGFVLWATLPTSLIQAERSARVKRKPQPAFG